MAPTWLSFLAKPPTWLSFLAKPPPHVVVAHDAPLWKEFITDPASMLLLIVVLAPIVYLWFFDGPRFLKRAEMKAWVMDTLQRQTAPTDAKSCPRKHKPENRALFGMAASFKFPEHFKPQLKKVGTSPAQRGGLTIVKGEMLRDEASPKPHRADKQQQKLPKETLKRTPSFLLSALGISDEDVNNAAPSPVVGSHRPFGPVTQTSMRDVPKAENGVVTIQNPDPTPAPKLSTPWKVALAIVSFYSNFGMICLHFLAFELAALLYLSAEGIPPFILLVWAYTCGSHFSYLFHAMIAALPVFKTEEEKGQICGKGLGYYFLKSHRTPFQAVGFAEHKIADVTGHLVGGFLNPWRIDHWLMLYSHMARYLGHPVKFLEETRVPGTWYNGQRLPIGDVIDCAGQSFTAWQQLGWSRLATVLCGTEALRFFMEHDVAGGHAETMR